MPGSAPEGEAEGAGDEDDGAVQTPAGSSPGMGAGAEKAMGVRCDFQSRRSPSASAAVSRSPCSKAVTALS